LVEFLKNELYSSNGSSLSIIKFFYTGQCRVYAVKKDRSQVELMLLNKGKSTSFYETNNKIYHSTVEPRFSNTSVPGRIVWILNETLGYYTK
jgi:hypothetical protein